MSEGAPIVELERRRFLELLGGGLVVLLAPWDLSAQESGRGRGGRPLPQDLEAWLHIGEDGAVTVYTGKVEVGQDIRTTLAQAVAEELHSPLESIRLVMGDTDLTPFDMGTFGSRTTPTMAPQLRRAAATAREALLDVAALEWKVDRAALTVAEGRVLHVATKRSAGFGELTRGQKLVKTIHDDVATTPTDRWRVLGRPAAKVNGGDIVTGRHKYVSDMTRPGLLHGKVLRPPAMGATLTSVDGQAASAMPGATVVRDGEFVGVVADSVLLATRARDALRAEWKTPPQPSSATLFADLRKTAESDDGERHVIGSVAQGLASAPTRLEETYTVAYIAHAPLEPRAAVAEWQGGKLTVWTGSQRPFGVHGELVEAFHLPEDKVRVIVPDTGAAYGGKHTGEAALEAARLAKGAGRPVKVVWTREEEFAWAYFRPAGVIDVKSAATADGRVAAWEFHNINSGSSGIRTPYDVPNQMIAFHPARSPLRQGSYRGLAATANHFARETHMDELARALSLDPLELRRRNLSDARFRAVLDAVAERLDWGRSKASADRGRGIAGGTEKGSYVATAAELVVERPSGLVRLLRLVTAFECGAIVNPDRLKSQVEGAVIQGIGGALYEKVDFGEGRILNGRFSRYRVPRFGDIPPMEVILLDRKDLAPAGAGETPIVTVAPAIGNAIFDATGVRPRALPLGTVPL